MMGNFAVSYENLLEHNTKPIFEKVINFIMESTMSNPTTKPNNTIKKQFGKLEFLSWV